MNSVQHNYLRIYLHLMEIEENLHNPYIIQEQIDKIKEIIGEGIEG